MSTIRDAWLGLSSFWKIMAVGLPTLAAFFAVLNNATPAVNAWDGNGLPTIATRGWVRENTRDVQSSLTVLRLDSLNGKIEAQLAARNKLELDALKYDDEGKVKAAQEMRRLDESLEGLRSERQWVLGIRRAQ